MFLISKFYISQIKIDTLVFSESSLLHATDNIILNCYIKLIIFIYLSQKLISLITSLRMSFIKGL